MLAYRVNRCQHIKLQNFGVGRSPKSCPQLSLGGLKPSTFWLTSLSLPPSPTLCGFLSKQKELYYTWDFITQRQQQSYAHLPRNAPNCIQEYLYLWREYLVYLSMWKRKSQHYTSLKKRKMVSNIYLDVSQHLTGAA